MYNNAIRIATYILNNSTRELIETVKYKIAQVHFMTLFGRSFFFNFLNNLSAL